MAAIPGQIDAVASQATPRSASRRKLLLKAQDNVPGRSSVPVLDISTTGLLLQTAGELALNERIELDLPGSPTVHATVRWSRGGLHGCQFVDPVSEAFVSAALLRSAPRPREPGHWSEPNPDASDTPDHDATGGLSGAACIGVIVGVTAACWAAIAALLLA